MRRNLLLVLFSAAMGVAALHYGSKSWATASNGFAATTLAKGSLPEFEVFNHFILPSLSEEDQKVWLSTQKTKERPTFTCRAMSGSRRSRANQSRALDGTRTPAIA